jgi:DNA-binding transcriptional LysR family regulator
MDRLDRLRTFIAVADRASFAEAARHLHISSTTATRAVSTLEEELGITLVRRTTRSVRLTDEGAIYLERCRNALHELEDAADLARGSSAEPQGLLVVTAPILFGRMHVLPIISQLLVTYPNLEVRLMLIDRVVRLVDEGIDVAVRIGDLSDSALHAVRVAEVRRVLSASPDYAAKHGLPVDAADLHNHDLILFDGLADPHNEWRFGGEDKPIVRIKPRLIVNNADAAIAVARSGSGITRTFSYHAAPHFADGSLLRVLPQLEPHPTPVHLVFQAHRRRSANVRVFLDSMKRCLNGSSL